MSKNGKENVLFGRCGLSEFAGDDMIAIVTLVEVPLLICMIMTCFSASLECGNRYG